MKMRISPFRKSEEGMALLLTLGIIVMITIIVITYTLLSRTEVTSSRSAYDKERARLIAEMAVDDVVAKLADTIPTDSDWAAAPGRVFNLKTGANTLLHSGNSGSDQIALNSPIPGVSKKYPIIPQNTEYPDPNPMKVDWIYVLENGTRSIDSGYNPSKENPIVGRYGYWTDLESAKVNLNTAGKAQTTYTTTAVGQAGDGAGEDIQNLTGHPSRVNLAGLDGVGSAASSLATYNFAAGSAWYGGDGADNTHDGLRADPVPRAAGQGMKRFNTIEEWARIPGITATMIERNKFYLTTRGRVPETNPWGNNRLWFQMNAGPQAQFAPYAKGNFLNAPGAPRFAVSTILPWGSKDLPDNRYYVYPPMSDRSANQTGHLQSPNWMGHNTSAQFQKYMERMVELLSRKDWPGMPARSFVDKYGLEECETLAANLLYLYDSINWGFVPALTDAGVPGRAAYGSMSLRYQRPGAPPRYFGPVGPFPYLNEVAVTFSPTSNGEAKPLKDEWGPAQAPPITPPVPPATQSQVNVQVDVKLESVYPPNLGHNNTLLVSADGITYARAAATSLEVFATGVLDGQPVTYGHEGQASPQPTWEKAAGVTTSQYTWGAPDEQYDMGALHGLMPATHKQTVGGVYRAWVEPSNTPFTDVLGPLYIGPFDAGSTVEIEVKFRVFTKRMNIWTAQPALQIVPWAVDNTNDPDSPAAPTKFSFSSTFVLDGIESPTVSYEVVDPRVSRYASDWRLSTGALGHTLGATNSVHVSEFLDPLTGIKGDESKFTWPNVGAATRSLQNFADPRTNQNATNIVGFPGIGWLSVLPTNIETGGTWSGGVRTPNPAGTVPWRTLSLEPATKANDLPDWLLLDLFSMAYDKTFLSQTEGKINVNAKIAPFGINRLEPLKALLVPSHANPTTSPTAIAQRMADLTDVQSGPGGGLPADMFVYAGQICQIPQLAGSGTTQWEREALMRDLAGLVTTKSSDFKIYVVSQSLLPNKQNPAAPGKVAAEQRMEAIISRETDVGPDLVPGTLDDPEALTAAGGEVKLRLDGSDPDLVGHSGRPPFRYQINNLKFQTP